MNTVYDVLRALIDAVFRSGAVTDIQHAVMHEVVNGADPGVAEAKAKAETELSDAERAELDRLLAKQQAADAAAAAPAAEPAAPTGL